MTYSEVAAVYASRPGKSARQEGMAGVLARAYSCRWEALQGERDGREDGRAVGVKPLALFLLERFYSLAYRQGYHRGYTEARSTQPEKVKEDQGC